VVNAKTKAYGSWLMLLLKQGYLVDVNIEANVSWLMLILKQMVAS
jgi:hypothetical protein